MVSSLPPDASLDEIPVRHPPQGLTSDFVHPVTLSTEIITASVVSLALALILLCIRLYATLRITRSASYDDSASVCAWIFSLAHAGLIIASRSHSRHSWDIPLSFITPSYLKIVLSETIILAVGFLFAKISILLFYQRLFTLSRVSRYCVYIAMAWTTVISSSAIIVDVALCAPRSGESFSIFTGRRCERQTIWSVTQGCLNVLLDFFILYIPIPILWKVQMDRRKKIGVSAVFLTGFIACIASALNLWIKVEFHIGSDIIWNSFRVDVSNVVEINTAIMAACMPACVSFARFFVTKASPSHPSQPRVNIPSRDLIRRHSSASMKNDNHWTFENLVSHETLDFPPHIVVKGQPVPMRMGRIDVLDGTNDDRQSLPDMNSHMQKSLQERLQRPTAAHQEA